MANSWSDRILRANESSVFSNSNLHAMPFSLLWLPIVELPIDATI
ncbi:MULTISPECIES: hypothetical protein [Limnospira]|uniref:Uncharacterized protein n=1 Tax=Limnospira indica PCC 8005 TaxID=376219 RepID=A0A9P1KEH4_9CYAN|nr:hypothetical protein [Limnospira indica]MDT9187631.1 hypothetical protein [Limnospira sp. PMC 894.15]MDT9235871.1 hypothetical protein [Limnospira sp. PMC 917.15]MDY7054509.1 hypothetical protein [Limnospira fusiformis LS22]CDM93917.1 hypothetical protein ARTHRO_11591 [Limnospira indica PCC 8005]MDY7054528.1 hypothetical protein [Limnospira fusiformis LS22]